MASACMPALSEQWSRYEFLQYSGQMTSVFFQVHNMRPDNQAEMMCELIERQHRQVYIPWY